MPKYTYKGKNIYGNITEGVYEGPDETSVAEMLKSQNYYVLEIKPLVDSRNIFDFEGNKKIPTKDLMLFCKQFSLVLKAAIPMLYSLQMVSDQTESKVMKKAIAEIIKDLRTGASLSTSIKNQSDKFPQVFIYMIEAGEESGTLDKSLDSLYNHFEKMYKTQKKFKSGLSYPIMVIIVAIIVTVILMTVVVPTFISLFDSNNMELPGPTKALILISNFLINYGFLTFLIIVGLLLVLKVYNSTPNGGLKLDYLKLKLPPFAVLYVKNASSRFASTMSTLLSAGVGIAESLDITSKVVGNRYIAEALQNVRRSLISGKGLTGPIKEEHIFPPMLENMIMMGEESGSIEAMLNNAANLYDEEVDTAVQRITDMIQPAIIIILGGVVGFIVLAVALPLFSLY